MTKSVKSIETAEFRGTEELYINTTDGWTYVFQRPVERQPYTLKERRRPDGSLCTMKCRTPRPVVEYMEENYDCAGVHPQPEKYDQGRWNVQS